MTDIDIVKALECCNKPVGKNSCEDCPFHHSQGRCTENMLTNALDLINRQQFQLDNYSHNVRNMSKDFLVQQKIIQEQQAEINRQKAEIEKLQLSRKQKLKEIERLKKENDEMFDSYTQAVFLQTKRTTEAIKKLVDVLKTKKLYSVERHEYIVPVAVIDWTEKEMVGEQE
jgi:rRNA-processing protein FCF1